MREAWFSILGSKLVGARVLDLYAGTGALGLESLSRGASAVTFVERHRRALAMLEANIHSLAVEDVVEVVRDDALHFVGAIEAPAFDVAFADPPYRSDAAGRLVERFREAPFARIFSVEHASDVDVEGDDSRRYGGTRVTFCFT